jgi:hypothetical protein
MKKASSWLVLFVVLSSSGMLGRAVVQGGAFACTITEGPPGSEVSLAPGNPCGPRKLPCVGVPLGDSGERDVFRAGDRVFRIKASRGLSPEEAASPMALEVVTLSREDDDGFAAAAVGIRRGVQRLEVRRPNQKETTFSCSELL